MEREPSQGLLITRFPPTAKAVGFRSWRIMKHLILIAFLASVSYAGANLDSLVKESKAGEQKAHHVGWMATKKMPLIPTTAEVGGGRSKSIMVEDTQEESSQDLMIKLVSSRVDEMQANQEKLTLIVASLQNQSNTHSDNQDFTLKLVEIFMGAIATLAAAYITAKIAKKI